MGRTVVKSKFEDNDFLHECRFSTVARLRCEMMAERDRHRDTVMTDADWQHIEDGLRRSWAALKQAVP